MKEMAAHSVFLPEKSHKQRRLMGYSPWGYTESDVTEHHTHTQDLANRILFIKIGWKRYSLNHMYDPMLGPE